MIPGRLMAVAGLLAAMLSIQTGASLAKGLFPLVGPAGTTALRLAFAALILVPVFRPWRVPLTRRDRGLLLRYGATLGAMNLLFYMAAARIPLGIAVAIEFIGPLGVALASSRRPADFLWAGLAAGGLALLVPSGEADAALDPVGVGFAVGAGVAWGLYILAGQRAGGALHGGTATALGMGIAALLVLPIGAASAGARLLDPSLIPLAAAVGLLSSAIPYTLEMAALQRLPTKTFGILMSLEPAIAALAGLIFLSERLTIAQWAAIGCVMIASFGSVARRDDPPVQA